MPSSNASRRRVKTPPEADCREAVLAAIDRAFPPREMSQPGDVTIREYAQARGLSYELARNRLDQLCAGPDATLEKHVLVYMPGRPRPVTVYRLRK